MFNTIAPTLFCRRIRTPDDSNRLVNTLSLKNLYVYECDRWVKLFLRAYAIMFTWLSQDSLPSSDRGSHIGF